MNEDEMVCSVILTKKSQVNDVCLFSAQTSEFATATKHQSLEKTLMENSKLPPRHPLVKNEHTACCAHKSMLMWACLHTCVYELGWMCVLSLHESAVITQLSCPWGCSFYLWLFARCPHFIVPDRKTAVCVCVLTTGSRV